ncbi:MAG: diacylglycerol kinase [Candidatus Latescibacterota bacterium]|jgi:diacylglycerol kinase (ATP)
MLLLRDLWGLPARLWRGTRFSLQGLAAAWRYQQAVRLELLACVLVIPAACLLGRTGTQRALLIGSWVLVLIVELLNSAIETAVDRTGTETDVLAGRAKDLASAAVFVAILLALAVWGLVLGCRPG